MNASKILKKHIIIEIIALFFLIGSLLYAYLMIQKSNQDVKEQDGMVIVLDDSSLKTVEPHSDGVGFQTAKITCTVTNNNKEKKEYKIIVNPKMKNNEMLKHIKVGIDGLYAYSLKDLEKTEKGYILTTNVLDQGFTNVHIFQYWLDSSTNTKISAEDIDFTYSLENEKK